MGPRAGIREHFLPYQGLNSDLLAIQPVASHYTKCAVIIQRYPVVKFMYIHFTDIIVTIVSFIYSVK
jgi:hypothetical protein